MSRIISYALIVLLAYLLGTSNLAYFIARRRGINILQTGTNNPGASNAMMLMGWKMGILVGLHDIGKAFLAAFLAGLLFPELPLSREVAGAACVLGHMFPFYLNFRGGKGFASTLGMIAALNWRFVLLLGVAIIVVVLITDYIVTGTVLTVLSYPIYCLATHQLIAAAILACIALIILFKHRGNFVRIWKGTEVGLRRAHKGELRVDREG